MVNCSKCGDATKKAEKVVVESREKVYPPRYKVIAGDKRVMIDKGGVGREIVREAYVCTVCQMIAQREQGQVDAIESIVNDVMIEALHKMSFPAVQVF